VQVFDNLLSNALKFTSPPGSITVSAEASEHSVVVRIRDTGVGMRPEMLSRIFQAFHQETQDAARSAGGLGLGLALAKGLVELHQGAIHARSDGPGKGAEFEVRLPRQALGSAERPSYRAPKLEPQRILIVEDNDDAAQMLCELLESRGHKVRRAPSGSAALEILRADPIDIILCDLGLPVMSGYELAKVLRSEPSLRDIPLVAVTGYSQPEDRRRSIAAGFDDHLVKPVTLQAIDGVLARFATREEKSNVG
jgi:CheY-like chemotaxis protein